MKKLILIALLLMPLAAQASNATITENIDGINIDVTMDMQVRPTAHGEVECMVTTVYSKAGSKIRTGADSDCNWALHNCNYLGICPGGSEFPPRRK